MTITNRIFLIAASIFLSTLLGCDDPTKANSGTTVTFAVNPDFVFGNATGRAKPDRIWVAGTFNEWTPNHADSEMALGDDGVFRLSVPASSGTVVKFKLVIKTTLTAPYSSGHAYEGDWMTDMEQAYALSPAIMLSPSKTKVTFEDDGYQGQNAVFTVP